MMLKLHNYQIRAKDFILKNNKSILAVGMGLGKTAATLHALMELNPNSCAIVAPKRVAESVWLQEAEKWGLIDVVDKMVIVAGTPEQRKKKLSDTERPYKIIGRDNLSDIQNMRTDMLILDELTSFKNVESKRTKFTQSIRAEVRAGLTGTFLANGTIDVFGQAGAIFNDVNPLGRNFYSWRARHFYDAASPKVRWHIWRLMKEISLEDVIFPIRDNIFTLDSSDWLEVPEVEEIVNRFELSRMERMNYDNMNQFLTSDLGSVYSEEQKFSKLSTLTNDFIYPDRRLDRPPVRGSSATKLNMIADFCEQAVGEGEQVLLFYAFREEAVWLGEMMKKRGIRFCSPADKRFIEKWESGEIDVLMAHPASAGHGLNLQHGGRIIVWSTLTYNYEFWAQANARLVRQGQKRGVRIYYFIAERTVEERQLKALRYKEKMDRQFIDLTKVRDVNTNNNGALQQLSLFDAGAGASVKNDFVNR